MAKRKTHTEFINEIQEKQPNIVILSEYINNRTKISVMCKECGHRWEVVPNSLSLGVGCPNCAIRMNGEKRRKSQEVFEKEARIKNPEIRILGEYINAHSKILVKCRKCEYEWETTPASVLRHRGCPRCTRRIHKNTEQFIIEVAEVTSDIEVIGEYKNALTRIAVRCKRCNYEWQVMPNSILYGSGCPRCSHSSTSVIEQIIYYSLLLLIKKDVTVLNGDIQNTKLVLNRDKTAIGKEIDIFVPSIKLAIEFGSWYWHKDRLENDVEKERLCEAKGIRLITLYERCPANIPDIGLKNARYYSKIISAERDYISIYNFMKDICAEYSFEVALLIDNWKTIITTAKRSSLKITKDDLVEKLAVVNPNIIIEGEYKGNGVKISVCCKICGHRWEATPNNLLKNHGCPQCAIKKNADGQRLTHEDFIERLKENNPVIEVIGKYTGQSKKIKVKCKNCQYEWEAQAGNLLCGSGCPKCAGNIKKDKNQIVEELKEKNPAIIIKGAYINTNTKVLVQCKKCKYEWNTTIVNLMGGHGCPKCKGGVKRQIRCVETGVVYESLSQAKRITGFTSIASCLTGHCKTAGGYHWAYCDNEDVTVNK